MIPKRLEKCIVVAVASLYHIEIPTLINHRAQMLEDGLLFGISIYQAPLQIMPTNGTLMPKEASKMSQSGSLQVISIKVPNPAARPCTNTLPQSC